MGHTCPECHSANVTVGKFGQFDLGECGDCSYVFPTWQSRTTNTICPACKVKFNAEHKGCVVLAGALA
jgi:RNA polymerase subunit RPABC4/transcription elongation factor Spt4